jgi:hypothetical protein
MVAKVYPNGPTQTADPLSVHGGVNLARSYTVYVPRSVLEMAPWYNSFDFIPEQKKYILSSYFCAENVSKWKLPVFPPEDTALNWYESVTVYLMGLGVFVPPYGSLEQGNPKGKLWFLVSRDVPFAADLVSSWSNAIFTLLSEAINGTTPTISCARPTRAEQKGILVRNNGNGYKALYDFMQFHATQLNMGTSSRIRDEGPPGFGKSKSVDEYLGRYREYWVQRYYFSSNRTVCLSPELQLNFVNRLPCDIKLAYNMCYWRPEYDDAPPEFWMYDSIPKALMFQHIAEYINMACERQDVNLDNALQKTRAAGITHATYSENHDELLSTIEADSEGVTSAPSRGPATMGRPANALSARITKADTTSSHVSFSPR